MRHFQFMRGGSMSKDTHQVDHHNVVVIVVVVIVVVAVAVMVVVVVVVVVDERGQLWNCGSGPSCQVESNLSRLNFWSLAHLLLMLVVGVSQVLFIIISSNVSSFAFNLLNSS